MSPATPSTVDLRPEEVRLTHDVSSIFHLSDLNFESYFTLTAAASKHEELLCARTQGHRIVLREPEMLPAPFVLHFTGEGEDLVVYCFKHRNGIAYYYGVSAEKLKDFVPPAKPDAFKEEMLFRTVRCSMDTVSHASPLVDTESCKFRAKFLSVLALVPAT